MPAREWNTEQRGLETMAEKIVKTEQEWMQQLTPEQFQICRLKGTERPYTGKYNDEKRAGVYRCTCCGHPLFKSDTKYDSGSGWPSFYAPLDEDAVAVEEDLSLGMRRVEVMCAKCDSHLGHVFEDGPAPTGLRYCMNSVSLDLEPEES
jgi:peptide-methionine (R)-S-oxide reductase